MREDRIDKLVDRVETTSVVQDWEEEKEMRMVMKELVDLIVPEALAWTSLNGLVVGDKSIKGSGTNVGLGMVHAPLSLFPTSFPQNAFMQAVQLATDFNILIDRVSQDTQFLQEALASTKKVDSFTARLLDIHSQMLEEGLKQEIQLGLHRSDYMLDMAKGSLLQVEINTISSSFAGLGSLISKLHR
jgi:glutathione synthetase